MATEFPKDFITEFEDYRDLPFPKDVQDYLFSSHQHKEEDGSIIYSEKDVLILLQMINHGTRR